MPLTEALRNIHFPVNRNFCVRHSIRLKFEELFMYNSIFYAMPKTVSGDTGDMFLKLSVTYSIRFIPVTFLLNLPVAQKRVLKEIRQDVGSGRQMNRLLQGDVGSGKTLVALMSMLMALDNGYQACMMAPTEILANQHYETIKEFLFRYGYSRRITYWLGER